MMETKGTFTSLEEYNKVVTSYEGLWLTIIIPYGGNNDFETYNIKKLLEWLIPKVNRHKQCQLIVVDNSEDFKLRDMDYGKHITYIMKNEIRNAAYARNVGLDFTSGMHCTFIDADDTIVRNDFVYQMLCAARFLQVSGYDYMSFPSLCTYHNIQGNNLIYNQEAYVFSKLYYTRRLNDLGIRFNTDQYVWEDRDFLRQVREQMIEYPNLMNSSFGVFAFYLKQLNDESTMFINDSENLKKLTTKNEPLYYHDLQDNNLYKKFLK